MNGETEFEFGIVTVFDSFKGFGFIRREKGKDVFCMYEDILLDDQNLVEGDRVTFVVKDYPKGPRAFQISKLG